MGRWLRRADVAGAALFETSAVHTVEDVVLHRPDSMSESLPPAVAVDATGSTIVVRYIWNEEERTARFPAVGCDDVAGALPSAPSGPLREYEDKLKAIGLCARGMEKSDVAQRLGRSEHWVKRWWRQNPQLISKPAVAHGVLVQNAPLISFRDLELRRGFVPAATKGPSVVDLNDSVSAESLLEELVQSLHWEPARRATRDSVTGALRVRFDWQGKSMTQPGRFVAQYRGGSARLDVVLQRAAAVANIRDPCAHVFLNRYESGCVTCPQHRHDFWTCMLSLGADRVALVEHRPLLLRNGDLLVFGTQAHGLPAMPDVSGRRISVVVFYYPDAGGIERRFATTRQIGDDSDDGERCEGDGQKAAPTTKAISHAVASASGRLVDAELLGCPGISLGFAGRRVMRATTAIVVFSIGCGTLTEGNLFGLLQDNNAKDLWDIRPSGAQCAHHWAPGDAFRRTCAARMIRYRHVPLGRPDAGGIGPHLASEEGLDILARIVEACVVAGDGGHGVAILGRMEDWSECERQAVACALTSGVYGPVSVLHLSRSAIEIHPTEYQIPAWLGPPARTFSSSVASTPQMMHVEGKDILESTQAHELDDAKGSAAANSDAYGLVKPRTSPSCGLSTTAETRPSNRFARRRGGYA